MTAIHKYTLSDEVAKDIRFVARFELHNRLHPECPLNDSLAHKEEVRRRIADRVFAIILEQEIKKLNHK